MPPSQSQVSKKNVKDIQANVKRGHMYTTPLIQDLFDVKSVDISIH
jgi:hypothetical protein